MPDDSVDPDEDRSIPASYIVAKATDNLGKIGFVVAVGIFAPRIITALAEFAGTDTRLVVGITGTVVAAAALTLPGMWAALKVCETWSGRLNRRNKALEAEILELHRERDSLQHQLDEHDVNGQLDGDGHDRDSGGEGEQ